METRFIDGGEYIDFDTYTKLREQCERLREQNETLKKYAQHYPSCKIRLRTHCDCGFTQFKDAGYQHI